VTTTKEFRIVLDCLEIYYEFFCKEKTKVGFALSGFKPTEIPILNEENRYFVDKKQTNQ